MKHAKVFEVAKCDHTHNNCPKYKLSDRLHHIENKKLLQINHPTQALAMVPLPIVRKVQMIDQPNVQLGEKYAKTVKNLIILLVFVDKKNTILQMH